MSSEVKAHGGAEQLIQMANDIGNFFRAESDRDAAIDGIANHILKFWTKRMRQKLTAHGEEGLDELPLAAVRRIAEHRVPPEKEHAGGDAG
jgi:formate dehydrogenase subunit delta